MTSPQAGSHSTRPSKKRTKYIYPTEEVPHLWAHQSVERASNPQHNLTFDGDVITSYRHWPIASHVRNRKGTKKAILVRTDTYSVTTSRQQYAVRSAIPRTALVFYVPDVSLQYEAEYHHAQNLAYFVEQSKKALKRSERARMNPEADLQEAFANKEAARQYAQFFSLASPAKLFAFLPTGKKLAEQKAKMAARMERVILAGEVREEKARQARAERERIAELELPEKIASWREGAYVHFGYGSNVPTLLRISKDGQNVETSRGASVPASHAKRGLTFVRKVVASGHEYVRNGHTFHLGHYAIDRIEVNGTLHAGCHVIPYAEIESLAPFLEVLAVQKCNQCEALMINGVFCHETGCPNTNARFDAESGEWIKQRKCFDCGCSVDADDPCCSAPVDERDTLCPQCGNDNCTCQSDWANNVNEALEADRKNVE